MRKIERLVTMENPYLFDKVIKEVQTGLANRLSWLTHSFGRCERLVKEVNGRRVYTPNIYLGKNEYLMLTPDQRLGNYSFFVMEEPERLAFERGLRTVYRAPFSLVVWVDMRTIEDGDTRNTEKVKDAIVKAVNGIISRYGGLTLTRVYNHAERVFEGFSLDEVDNQYLMSPFCGWRFMGEIWVREDCAEPEPAPDPEPDNNDNENNDNDDNG